MKNGPPIQPSSPSRTEVIIPEVLPPEEPTPSSTGTQPSPRLAFHPLSALALVLVDNLWNIPEFFVLDWPITIPLAFLSVFAVTLTIQRKKNRDSWGAAVAKAALLAVLAAIPTSITGTPIGLALLAWAGIRHPWKSR